MSAHHRQPHPALPLGHYGAVPVGAVIAFAGRLGGTPQQPDPATLAVEAWGWMACDGRLLAIALYPELFAFIGHQYDDASQADHFRIPDYRGYFLRGVDGGAGNDPDSGKRSAGGSGAANEVGSHQGDAIRDHQHGIDPGGAATVEAGTPSGSVKTAIATAGPPAPVLAAGVSANETRPMNISVHYLIRFTARPVHAPSAPWAGSPT